MPTSSDRVRLDVLLVQRGYAESREVARRLIMAAEVTVNGGVATKPGIRVPAHAELALKQKPRFVSRGGEKLADVGASTGGFTDCLLQNGAARVYALDVGYGQLAWTLRQDERVVVMERVNARYVTNLAERIDFAAVDVSFISLRHIFLPARGWLHSTGHLVALVKPQFEAGRGQVGKGGVVRSPEIHQSVLEAVSSAAQEAGFYLRGLMTSPLLGPAGNVEFLLWLSCAPSAAPADVGDLISAAIDEAHPNPDSSRGE
jgi:23S rRNA (cytidine1920-2'-O)/16S rRNA (cytidine1409-2'-O)-methyltransferase